MSEGLLLVSIQSPRISLSDSSGSLFCRKSSSIPSMKLPSFWKCDKREGNAIFWVGKKGLDYRCFKCCCKKPEVFFVQPPPSSSDPACWVTWDLSARYSLQRRGQLDSTIFCLDTSTMDLNLPARYPLLLYFQYNNLVYCIPHFRQEIHLPPANSKSFRRSMNPGRSRFQIDFVVFSSSFREKNRCDSRHMNHNMILETGSLSVSTTLNQPIEFQYLMIDYDQLWFNWFNISF